MRILECIFRTLKTLQQAIHRINLVKRSLAAPGNLLFPFSIISKKCLLGLLLDTVKPRFTDTSLLRTVFFVPGERKPLALISLNSTRLIRTSR